MFSRIVMSSGIPKPCSRPSRNTLILADSSGRRRPTRSSWRPAVRSGRAVRGAPQPSHQGRPDLCPAVPGAEPVRLRRVHPQAPCSASRGRSGQPPQRPTAGRGRAGRGRCPRPTPATCRRCAIRPVVGGNLRPACVLRGTSTACRLLLLSGHSRLRSSDQPPPPVGRPRRRYAATTICLGSTRLPVSVPTDAHTVTAIADKGLRLARSFRDRLSRRRSVCGCPKGLKTWSRTALGRRPPRPTQGRPGYPTPPPHGSPPATDPEVSAPPPCTPT